MLKKRLVGVVTVKNGWAVQSFGYCRYLPLGKPECLVENLDRWGADEILVQVVDRSAQCVGPDFELLARLGALGLKTPLIYAGGIRSIPDGVQLIQTGADRLVIDALLHDDLEAVRGLSERVGAQALIASMPVSLEGEGVEWLDYRNQTSTQILPEVREFLQSGVISEVLISDWRHEGTSESFDDQLITKFPLHDVPVIAFGGLSKAEQMRVLLQSTQLSAIAVGNFLSYREHAMQKYKEALTGTPLRPATYQSSF